MGSLSRLIREKGGELGEGKTNQVKVQQIHYTKLKESEMNFYTRSEDEVAELADTMLIAGGILQPLIVRKTDLSEYEILAGHKRRRASIFNVERGYKEYEFLPCIVIDMSGLMAKKISEKILAEQGDVEDDKLLDMIAEYIVICTNSTASESSQYEKMMQAVRLSQILPAMLGNEDLKGRALRSEIAKEMKCGNGQIGRYQSIYNNLVPEAMERFRNGALQITAAYEMSRLEHDRQREALEKQEIELSDIELLKQKENHKTVSGSDTEKASGTELFFHEENHKTVSETDTEKVVEPVVIEPSEQRIYLALQLIFDDIESGFPSEIMKELSNVLDWLGENVPLMIDIFDKALPFENGNIRIERITGYVIDFKNEGKKTTVALWTFWSSFISKYRHNESTVDELAAGGDEDPEQNIGNDMEGGLAAVVDKGNKETTARTQTEAVQSGTDYTPEEVTQIYEEQVERMRQMNVAMKEQGDLSEGDKLKYRKAYKKAKIIRDGMRYILDTFKEGSIC